MYYNPPALKHLVFSSWENIDMSCILLEAWPRFFKGGSHCIKQRVLIRFSFRSPRLVLHKTEKGPQEGGGGGHGRPGTPHPLASYALGCILFNTAELPNILLNTNIYMIV